MLRKLGSGGQKGQALVEFALIAPVLLVMVMGIVDFGRVLFTYIEITQAAREGARLGSVQPCSNSNMLTRVNENVQLSGTAVSGDGTVSPGQVEMVVSYPDGLNPPAVGQRLKVRLAAGFIPITPFAGVIIGNLTIGSEAVTIVEAAAGC